jgi:hypothetical protein
MNKFNVVQENKMKQINVEHMNSMGHMNHMGPSSNHMGPSTEPMNHMGHMGPSTEHMAPTQSPSVICNASTATRLDTITNNSTCIGNQNNWMTITNPQFTSFAVDAKCANGTIPALRHKLNGQKEYKCT